MSAEIAKIDTDKKSPKVKPEKAPAKPKGEPKPEKAPKAEKPAKEAKAKPEKSPKPAPFDIDEILSRKPFATESYKLSALRLDGGTQPRVKTDPAVAEQYERDLGNGDKFPPLKAFEDEAGNLWLVDGFTRWVALSKIKQVMFPVARYKGTQAEARLYAAHVNIEHDKSGTKLSQDDKRRAALIYLADPKAKSLPNRKVAEILNVSHTFVANVRADLEGKAKPAKTAPVSVSVDPAGPEAAEPKGGNVATPSEPRPETVTLIDVESDEDFLGKCALTRQLKGLPEKVKAFHEQALIVRKIHGTPEYQAYEKLIRAEVKKVGDAFGPGKLKLLNSIKIPSATEWKLCLGCSGKGCTQCSHDGYHVQSK